MKKIIRLYKTEKLLCFFIGKRNIKTYYNNLDLKIFDDNKTFWQRIKSLFTDKQKSLQSDIILVENDIITSDKKEVAKKLNTFLLEQWKIWVLKRMYLEIQMKSNQKSY